MPAPAPTQLDANQVLRGAYDEAEGRLRTDSKITANISGAQEVIISHTDDSIKIGDGTDFLAVNADGSINVTSVASLPSNETSYFQYGEISSIPSASETNILSYTVPVATTFFFLRASVSGTNLAIYKVKVNGTTQETKRTWWTKFNEDFELSLQNNKGLELSAGDIVTVTVLHNSASLGDFNCTIKGVTLV
jgi:hypothetical protein